MVAVTHKVDKGPRATGVFLVDPATEKQIDADTPLPVTVAGGVELEFKNDTGNPLPVTSTQLPASLGAKAGTASMSVVPATDGVFAVTGSAAVGAAPVNPPVSVSGVDTSGYKRHVLTGTDGALANFGAQASFTGSITIGTSTTVGAAMDFGIMRPLRVVFPAALTSSTFYVQTSVDGSTYNDLYDEYGTRVSIAVGTSRSVALTNRAIWDGIRYMKLVAASAEAADRTITVVAQP